MTKSIDPHILKLFRVGQLMGSGAYGHVWKVENRQDGQMHALKKVFGAFRNSVDAQRTYREVEVLRQLNHHNIIKLQQVLPSNNKEDLYLLFELMEADLLAVVGYLLLYSAAIYFPPVTKNLYSFKCSALLPTCTRCC